MRRYALMADNKALPVSFDTAYAASCIESFACSTGTYCRIFLLDGTELNHFDYSDSANNTKDFPGMCTNCRFVHTLAARDSQRFGGRYIYACSAGLVFFSSPIIITGMTAAFVVCGPFLIMDPVDLITNTDFSKDSASCPAESASVIASLTCTPPERVSRLSSLLFLVTSHIGSEDMRRLLDIDESNKLQADIGDYIQKQKAKSPAEPYPLTTERDLISAITMGNKALASSLLNELFGYIFFHSGGQFTVIRARIIELLVILSRAAIAGGASTEDVFLMNHRYLNEIDSFTNIEDLTHWLSKIMSRYIDIVFRISDVGHADVIYRALEYIKHNYMNHITLEDAAEHVFLSPSYFSKVFTAEMETGFTQYLNRYRIERCKELLLSTSNDIVDICSLTGFDDQSYFSKVFKKFTGVTPGKFRECRGNIRINVSAEHGL